MDKRTINPQRIDLDEVCEEHAYPDDHDGQDGMCGPPDKIIRTKQMVHIIDPNRVQALVSVSSRRDSPAIKRLLEHKAPYLAHLPHAHQVTCALLGLRDIPRCPIVPSEKVFYQAHRLMFAAVGVTAFKIVRHDTDVKTSWLSWQHLLTYGLSLDEASKLLHAKALFSAREFFSGVNQSQLDVLQHLIKDGFTIERATELSAELNFNSFSSIKLFVDKIIELRSTKNHTIEFFTNRGHNLHHAKLLLREFFQAGANAVQKRVVEDAEYAAWFRSTRLPGLLAQQRNSKMEKAIGEKLRAYGYTIEQRTTHITSKSRLGQMHDRSWFCHDFYIKELNAIVEYNGVHWHPDRSFEIQKAAYVMMATGCRYILLWEGSRSNAAEYVEFIANSEGEFDSTDRDDVLALKTMLYAKQKEDELDTAFLDVADRLSKLSKCQSKQVCALAVRNGRIISTGLNGSVAGGLNCADVFPHGVNEANRTEHRAWSAHNEVHAEENLVGEAAAHGIRLRGCTIYVSMQPCQKCSTYLASIGSERVVYRHAYDFGDAKFSEALFRRCSILFDQHPLS